MEFHISPARSSSRPQVASGKAEARSNTPVCAQAPRAGHGLGHIWNRSVAPAADFIAEEPRTANGRETHRALAYNTAIGLGVAPHRRHLDHETVPVELYFQRRVVEVARFAMFVPCHHCFEDAAVPSHAARGIARAQRKPVQVDANKCSSRFVDILQSPATRSGKVIDGRSKVADAARRDSPGWPEVPS